MTDNIDNHDNKGKPVTIGEYKPKPVVGGCIETTASKEIIWFRLEILIARYGQGIIGNGNTIILGSINAATFMCHLIMIQLLAIEASNNNIRIRIGNNGKAARNQENKAQEKSQYNSLRGRGKNWILCDRFGTTYHQKKCTHSTYYKYHIHKEHKTRDSLDP